MISTSLEVAPVIHHRVAKLSAEYSMLWPDWKNKSAKWDPSVIQAWLGKLQQCCSNPPLLTSGAPFLSVRQVSSTCFVGPLLRLWSSPRHRALPGNSIWCLWPVSRGPWQLYHAEGQQLAYSHISVVRPFASQTHRMSEMCAWSFAAVSSSNCWFRHLDHHPANRLSSAEPTVSSSVFSLVT